MTDMKARQVESGVGFLQVRVWSSYLTIPVEGAQIQIQNLSNNTIISEILTTDEVGLSSIVELPTPPLRYSLEPNEVKPFSTFTLTITKENFETVLIEGVQIFPDTVAFQNISLTPTQYEDTEEVISINPPVLWGDFPPKIPESEVKPLTEFSGFIVLPEPVVPENIIVHDGIPTDKTATNYTVPFKDYIKNVACCEIYPTWPRESVKANILAIISFTLNRIYTEWYRTKGFSFNITSSTAYDQAFDYGRNIFDEISVIVDEVFTSYITKPGLTQPLLTQYCDGDKSKCPDWMSQWGSKDLGERGRSAIDILKYYYGQNIILKEATKVESIPRSFPGRNLSRGSTGADVRTIQEQINAISNNFPLILKVPVNGTFDQKTEDSVKTFQEVFKLPSNGIVDQKTWYKLSEIFVAVTKMLEI